MFQLAHNVFYVVVFGPFFFGLIFTIPVFLAKRKTVLFHIARVLGWILNGASFLAVTTSLFVFGIGGEVGVWISLAGFVAFVITLVPLLFLMATHDPSRYKKEGRDE